MIDDINLTAIMGSDLQTPGFSLYPLQTTSYIPVRVGRAISGAHLYTGSFPVKMFKDGPGIVRGCAFRDATDSSGTIRADVTGHLVDLQ